MKRLFFLTLTLFAWLGYVSADEFVVSNLTIPKGGTANLEVSLNNPDVPCVGFQFLLVLPEGISVAQNENSQYLFAEGARMSGLGFTNQIKQNEGGYTVLSYNANVVPMNGTSGAIIYITLKAADNVAIGSKLNASLQTCKYTNAESESMLLNEEQTFQISVEENRLLLDETSTTAPEASNGAVDVRVRRSISADIWNTICLPFAMTEAQTKEAFGDDVQLAAFSDWSSEEDDDENIVGIEISFSTVDVADGIEANTPLLIKVANDVTEFTVDGVVVDPEEEPSVMIKHGTKKRDPESYMIGTYQAGTVLENMSLFLNNNKFWYSTGKTTMKAYRAFFNIYDILTDVEDSYAAVKMAFNLDGFETKVEGIPSTAPKGMIYDLSGRKLSKMSKKGVYIVNGKKEFIK